MSPRTTKKRPEAPAIATDLPTDEILPDDDDNRGVKTAKPSTVARERAESDNTPIPVAVVESARHMLDALTPDQLTLIGFVIDNSRRSTLVSVFGKQRGDELFQAASDLRTKYLHAIALSSLEKKL